MTIRKLDQIEKIVSHPLEDFFNIEPESTKIVRTERSTELLDYEEYDEKDKEIESSYQEIADAAMSLFGDLRDMMDTADTKLVARLTEVSGQMLGTALSATNRKAALKDNKDKLLARQRIAANKKGTNTLVVMDRNEMLRQLIEAQKEEENKASALDGEAVRVTKE